MGLLTGDDDPEQLICFCHAVKRGELIDFIRKEGAQCSLQKIQSGTCASTGCGGCEWDVREILDRELEQLKKF